MQVSDATAEADLDDAGSRKLSSDEFRAVIGHFASGVTVITTAKDGTRSGTTASAVSSLSLEPPMLLICMNQTSATGKAIEEAGAFAVNVLNEHQRDLAAHFATKGADKFAGVAVTPGPFGQPLLAEALAHLECRVTATARGGTHIVFMAAVETATAHHGTPLTYFRGQFGSLGPAHDPELPERLRRWLREHREVWGQALDLGELALEFQATPESLYLALGELAGEGVVRQSRSGSFIVNVVTLEVMEQALRSRCAIDLGVAEMTVGRLSAEQLAELRSAMEATLPLIVDDRFTGHFEDYPTVNDRFHETMIAFAGCQQLLRAYRRLAIADIFRGAHPRLGAAAVIGALNDDHLELVSAYEAEDLDRVRAVLLRHTDNSIEIARLAMSGQPEPTHGQTR